MLKSTFNSDIKPTEEANGYQAVNNFFEEQEQLTLDIGLHLNQTLGNSRKTRLHTLKQKYFPVSREPKAPNCPIEDFLDLISFKTLIDFQASYCKNTGHLSIPPVEMLSAVRSMQTAQCELGEGTIYPYGFLHSFQMDSRTPHQQVLDYVEKIPSISKSQCREKLRVHILRDSVNLLCVYDELVPLYQKKERYAPLKDSVSGKMKQNIHYFKNNHDIWSGFDFLEKVILNLP